MRTITSRAAAAAGRALVRPPTSDAVFVDPSLNPSTTGRAAVAAANEGLVYIHQDDNRY
jgi:hypothetical protein